jgi:3-oxoacyl-[acyl-carrier protein] reductase
MDRLKNKVALITGSARGLGRQIAQRFVDEGATVIINDLDLDNAQRTAEAMQGHAIAADVSDSAQVKAMFEEARDFAGRLDILVNNAGIGGSGEDVDALKRGEERRERMGRGEVVHNDTTLFMSDEAWDKMLAIHLRGTFLCSREGLKLMVDSDDGIGGAIINMGSIMGTYGKPGGVAYCAAKAGILGFTRALAHEVASRKIRVNSIAPGFIETDMTAPLSEMRPMLEAQTPLSTFGEPDDIAWAAVYLASDEAKFVTGQVLSPNGGWYMSQ